MCSDGFLVLDIRETTVRRLKEMNKHSSAHVGSQSLCDELLRELATLHPAIARSEAKEACAYSQPPHAQFVWIYHRKKSPSIRVYFRCPFDAPLEGVPKALSVTMRPKISTGWERRFPAFFELQDTTALKTAAEFLSEVAYPLSLPGNSGLAGVTDEDEEYFEGGELFRLHRQKERNRKAVIRKKKMVLSALGKLACEACDFDFAEFYGALGAGFAECHHRIPLAELKEEHKIHLSDLAIVCANCHRMLHMKPLQTVEELRILIQARRGA
jgi:hypothetical protein